MYSKPQTNPGDNFLPEIFSGHSQIFFNKLDIEMDSFMRAASSGRTEGAWQNRSGGW